jgi:hypothetical protein
MTQMRARLKSQYIKRRYAVSNIKIFWDPKGLELASLGTKEYMRITDDDTLFRYGRGGRI